MKLRFVLLFVFFLLAPNALGQAAEDDAQQDSISFSLPEIVVNSSRYSQNPKFIASRVQQLTLHQIESTGGSSLSDVLQRAGSVFLRSYGTGLSTLSMRGGNSSQSIITIDGVPLYDPQLGQVDLSLVPSFLLENVSILHGQGASLYGANGMSGVVDIETRSYKKMPAFGTIEASIGALQERQVEASLGFGSRDVRGLIAIKYGREEGDFLYEDPSLFPVETVRRQGADQLYSSYFGKVDWVAYRRVTTLSGWVNRFERGIPGPIGLQFRDERQWDNLLRFNLRHFSTLSKSTFSVVAGFQKTALRYANPVLQIDDTGQTYSLSLDANIKHRWDDNNLTRVGVDNALRKAAHPSLSNDAREIQTSIYAVGEHQLSRFVLLPSARLDRYTSIDDIETLAFSPNLGVNVHPFLFAPLYLKMQAGKSFKMPTFNDRYWQPGGNIDLQPEIGWGYEAGLLWDSMAQPEKAPLKTEFTVFRRHIKDQITWLPTSTGSVWSPVNLNGVLISGIESSFVIKPSFSNSLGTGFELIYSFTESKNQSDPASPSFNRPLRYTPAHLFKAMLGADKSFDKWTVGFNAFSRYTSRRYVTEDGSSSLPPYWVADMQLRMRLIAGQSALSLQFVVENIFDQKYEVIKGYQMPPRLMKIELGVSWPGN